RKHRPDAIWSTYPIATAHLIGLTLARLSGLPWIADFRDSMTEEHYPADPRVRGVFRSIERRAVQRASACVFTTPGTVAMYAGRYPDQPDGRWHCIANGYDEENFSAAAARVASPAAPRERLVLLHAGILYPSERDPRPFFAALARLKERGVVSADTLRISLRATGHDGTFRPMIDAAGLADIVALEPGIPYEEALGEMLTADGLLLFQASNCNHQIPAKLYEYLRARRPVLALTDPVGDTAKTLSAAGVDSIVRLDDADDIGAGLERFIGQVRSGAAPLASDAEIDSHSRRARTGLLAALLDDTVVQAR
ncbi:MAG: glycosyltransferase, partial [Pseudomonadota bacterium]